jgi:hypothetical protein
MSLIFFSFLINDYFPAKSTDEYDDSGNENDLDEETAYIPAMNVSLASPLILNEFAM